MTSNISERVDQTHLPQCPQCSVIFLGFFISKILSISCSLKNTGYIICLLIITVQYKQLSQWEALLDRQCLITEHHEKTFSHLKKPNQTNWTTPNKQKAKKIFPPYQNKEVRNFRINLHFGTLLNSKSTCFSFLLPWSLLNIPFSFPKRWHLAVNQPLVGDK